MKANDDSDRAFPIADIDAALRRAAIKARIIAKQTQTPVVIWQDGKIVEIEGDSLKLEELRREIAVGIKEAEEGNVAALDAKQTLARVRDMRQTQKEP